MHDALAFVAWTIGPSAAAAFAVAWLLGRLLPPAAAPRYSLAAGLAAGFFAGYALLPDWAALVPTRHWQWLPYLGIAAAVIGPVGAAGSLWAWERWLLFALLAIVAAWQLVPTWATLDPPRRVVVPLLTAYLFLLMGLLAALPARLQGPSFVTVLTASAVACAVLIAIGVSVKYGAVAAAAAAAAAGCWAYGVLLAPRPGTTADSARPWTLGLIPLFVVLTGGLAFVGAVEPSPKLYPLFLAPAAPLALWPFTAGPLARLSGWQAPAAQCVAVLAVLVGALAWILLGDGGSEW